MGRLSCDYVVFNSHQLQSRRRFSSIKIFDEKERSSEKLFFSKQDEALLKKIFEASPKASEGLEWAAALQEGAALSNEDKVKLVFMKNGIPPSANPQLLKELVLLCDKLK